MAMRATAAALILVVGTSLPAAAQTDEIQINMGWRDCLNVFEDYAKAFLEQGAEVLSVLEKEKTRSTAFTLKKELIVLSCQQRGWRGARFSIDVEEL